MSFVRVYADAFDELLSGCQLILASLDLGEWLPLRIPEKSPKLGGARRGFNAVLAISRTSTAHCVCSVLNESVRSLWSVSFSRISLYCSGYYKYDSLGTVL